ncbi:6595_t:CDS:2, partial [Dentiscutata heterogama]
NIHSVAKVSEVNSDPPRVMSSYGTSPKSDFAITSETASDISGVSNFTDTTSNTILIQDQNSTHLENIEEQKIFHSNTSVTDNNSLIKDEHVEMKQRRRIKKIIYPNSKEEIIFDSNIFDSDMMYAEKRTIYVVKKAKSENVDQVTSSTIINIKIDEPILETNKSNIISTIDKSSNLAEVNVKPSIDNLKNPTTNDVSSISDERNPSERIKNPSSETKRRSLLFEWLYPSDPLESTNENDFTKTSVTSSTQNLSRSPPKISLSPPKISKSPPKFSKSPPKISESPPKTSDLTTSTTINSSSTSTTSAPLNNDLPPSSQGSTNTDTSQKFGSSSKKPFPSRHPSQHSIIKDPPNPIVQTLPENGSFWRRFFDSSSNSGLSKISQKTDHKLITNVSISSETDKKVSKVAISSEVDKKPKISNEIYKKSKVTSEVDKKSKILISSDVDKKSSKVSISSEVDKKSKISSDVDKKVSTSPIVSPKLKPSMAKPAPVSIVLPKFDDFVINKPVKHPDSPAQKALHAINSYLFPPDKPYDGALNKWLDELTRSTIDVKKIAIIGVHGWFPAKLLRVVVGEPTGTSPKFCDMMAKAVLGYLSKHNISLPSEAITCIPLEGEGTIETREKLLHKNLLYNKTWCEALALADVVFVATHSQGTPVGTILLSRLIKEGLVNPKRQRICFLAMAGISHGPFPYLKDHYIIKYFVGRNPDADATRELFEFMDSESAVAKKYRQALDIVIQKGVKLVYVASMDDQVVPLYSGIFTGVDHPSIMRAIYVDGPLYQEKDFLINLIIFAIKLRNAGILDHGLITQLSEVIIGSLYGEGHSTLYNEIDVYTLAVQYLFEVPSLRTSEAKINKFQAQPKYNPYFLPWSVRGILEDKNVIRNPLFVNEITRLKKLYEDWDPPSRVLKELKFRLEPFRDAILGRWKL